MASARHSAFIDLSQPQEVREWDEREYCVTVTADGLYELNGQRFKSLSATARHITGTQWSGPKFFGLTAGKGGKR